MPVIKPCAVLLSLVSSELLIVGLDLVKNRFAVMHVELRKRFIGSILVELIEKTTDGNVMKAITKMVEDWIKTKVMRCCNLWFFLVICTSLELRISSSSFALPAVCRALWL